jgi:hypothetical protein
LAALLPIAGCAGRGGFSRLDLVSCPRRSHLLRPTALDLGKHLDRMLVGRYSPPGVVINDKLEILQFAARPETFCSPRRESRKATS